MDVYKPERWTNDALFRVEVREAYKKLVDQGWTDALRYLHPDERIYTFWDYFRNAFVRDAGLRIDHFLLSSEAAKRLTKAAVDKHVRGWEHTSDHAPVWIELQDELVKKSKDEARKLRLKLADSLTALFERHQAGTKVILETARPPARGVSILTRPTAPLQEPANDWPSGRQDMPLL